MEIRNSSSNQNFGMALRIEKGAQKKLEKCSIDTINMLKEAGEALKNTKFYHVEVGDDLSAKLVADKDAYFGLFKLHDIYTARSHGLTKSEGKLIEDKRIIRIDNTCGRTEFGVGRYIPYGETQPFFNVWGPVGAYNTVNDVPVLTKVAKILDGVAAEKSYAATVQEAAEKAEKTEVQKAVGSLLDTFGV